MKKLVNLSFAAVLCAMLAAPVAQATTREDLIREVRCGVSVTGPDSEFNCEVGQEVTVVCQNDNEIVIGNVSDQTSESGEALIENNTIGGDTGTGDSNNSSTTRVSVAIENANEACAVAEVPEEDEEEKEKPDDKQPPVKEQEKPCADDADKEDNKQCPVVPVAPQGGVGAGADVSNLPDTAGTSPVAFAGIAALSLAGAALAARFGLSAYARFKA